MDNEKTDVDLLWVQLNGGLEDMQNNPYYYRMDNLYGRLEQIGLTILLHGADQRSHVRCIAKLKDRFKIGISREAPYVCPILTEELIKEIELNNIMGLPLSSLSVKDFWPVHKSEFVNKYINQNKHLEYSIKWINNEDRKSILYYGVKL